MSIKITLVENHVNRNFKQYNIDDFTIKEILSNIQFFLSTEIVDNSLDKISKIDWNL